MRADCEVRWGTVSKGMSRLARLYLLQSNGCICVYVESIQLRAEMSCQMVMLLSVPEEDGKSLGQCFGPFCMRPKT